MAAKIRGLTEIYINILHNFPLNFHLISYYYRWFKKKARGYKITRRGSCDQRTNEYVYSSEAFPFH